MLLKSYLTGRQQSVILGHLSDSNNISGWETIKCRVPQGSILGPLVFLFYINDLPKIVNKHNSMVLYADDTSIIVTDTDETLKKILTRPLMISMPGLIIIYLS
jgi:hypothetical protein